MVRHNNMIPNGHFHKKWQLHVKTWFNQPMKKLRRRATRAKKLIRATPKPIQPLRPTVYCVSVRYNTKLRRGRGFTLQELKQAGINKKFARTIGIAVDFRRRNRVASIVRNVQRLKDYRSKLILCPSKMKEAIATDSGTTLNMVKQTQIRVTANVVSEEEKKFEAYVTLRRATCDAKYSRVRVKRKLSKMDTLEGVKVPS
ncbi:Ribosomal L13e domain containing protein [Asbolus verrucosus]|uniref:60S ribosomal protein L13 n=1 Tax=Asbolus verrucosus TaxID=1661398 RepID=A0A482V0I8_ASBVE|nr:Ribosomal L13e domain containing protein [Asbolus verrucosus]